MQISYLSIPLPSQYIENERSPTTLLINNIRTVLCFIRDLLRPRVILVVRASRQKMIAYKPSSARDNYHPRASELPSTKTRAGSGTRGFDADDCEFCGLHPFSSQPLDFRCIFGL